MSSLSLPSCPAWDWEQKPGVQAAPSHLELFPAPGTLTAPELLATAPPERDEPGARPAPGGWVLPAPAEGGRGHTPGQAPHGASSAPPAVQALLGAAEGWGRALLPTGSSRSSALLFRTGPAKSGAAALPKMVKASGAALAAAQPGPAAEPCLAPQTHQGRDGAVGRGSKQQADPLGMGSGKSPGSPALNPFLASCSPGLVLPCCATRQRAGLAPWPRWAQHVLPVAHLLLPFQATSSSCGSNGMLLPSFSTGLTYEARYGTDSQICQGKDRGFSTDCTLPAHPSFHLPQLSQAAPVLDVGPGQEASPDAALGHMGRCDSPGMGAVPTCPGKEGKSLPGRQKG